MDIDKLVNEIKNYEYDVEHMEIYINQIKNQTIKGRFLTTLLEKFENKETHSDKDSVLDYLNSINVPEPKQIFSIVDRLILEIRSNSPFGRMLLFLIRKSEEGKFK